MCLFCFFLNILSFANGFFASWVCIFYAIKFFSRSKRHEQTILPDANEHRAHKSVDNVAVASESLSPLADEKLYYSDNQKLSAIRDAGIQKR